MKNIRKLHLAKIIDENSLSPEHKRAMSMMSAEEVEALIGLKEQLGGGALKAGSTRQGWLTAL